MTSKPVIPVRKRLQRTGFHITEQRADQLSHVRAFVVIAKKKRLDFRYLAYTPQIFVPNLPYVSPAPSNRASQHRGTNLKVKQELSGSFWIEFIFSEEMSFCKKSCIHCNSAGRLKCGTLKLIQKHKLGKVPRGVLITRGQLCLGSAGGIIAVREPLCLHGLRVLQQNSNKAATGWMWRIRASRETALLICAPAGSQWWITGANPKVALMSETRPANYKWRMQEEGERTRWETMKNTDSVISDMMLKIKRALEDAGKLNL